MKVYIMLAEFICENYERLTAAAIRTYIDCFICNGWRFCVIGFELE